MMKSETSLTTVTLSDDTYGSLLLKVQEFYNAQHNDLEILSSSFLSDRFAKKAYYFAILKIKKAAGN